MEKEFPASVMVKAYEMAINEVLEAYPVDIFPSPSHEEYQAMNKDHSSFVTRNSADVGRHIAEVIRQRALEFANDLIEGEEADQQSVQSDDCPHLRQKINRIGVWICVDCGDILGSNRR